MQSTHLVEGCYSCCYKNTISSSERRGARKYLPTFSIKTVFGGKKFPLSAAERIFKRNKEDRQPILPQGENRNG